MMSDGLQAQCDFYGIVDFHDGEDLCCGLLVYVIMSNRWVSGLEECVGSIFRAEGEESVIHQTIGDHLPDYTVS